MSTTLDATIQFHIREFQEEVGRDNYPAGTYLNMDPEVMRAKIDATVRDTWTKSREEYKVALTVFVRENGSKRDFVPLLIQFLRNTQ